MAIRNIRRQSVAPGFATTGAAPIYVDSDDNKLKMIPAGSGTTEVEIVDASTAQTLTNKTLTAPVINNAVSSALSGTLAAAGSIQGDAGAIVVTYVEVTAGDGTKGVILPAATAGKHVFLKNKAAAVLKVYPATGEVINAIAANGSISMASLTSAVYFCAVAGTWNTIPLLPS